MTSCRLQIPAFFETTTKKSVAKKGAFTEKEKLLTTNAKVQQLSILGSFSNCDVDGEDNVCH